MSITVTIVAFVITALTFVGKQFADFKHQKYNRIDQKIERRHELCKPILQYLVKPETIPPDMEDKAEVIKQMRDLCQPELDYLSSPDNGKR